MLLILCFLNVGVEYMDSTKFLKVVQLYIYGFGKFSMWIFHFKFNSDIWDLYPLFSRRHELYVLGWRIAQSCQIQIESSGSKTEGLRKWKRKLRSELV